MPLPIAMAHRLAKRLADVRKAGVVPVPAPRRQVARSRSSTRTAARCAVDTVLICAQHREEVDVETLLAPDIEAEVIDPVLREFPDLDASEGARAGEPHGPVRDRRAEGRHRSHRAQDHRRHLRRLRAPRRRRVQRQGSRRRSTVRPPTWPATSAKNDRRGRPRRPGAAPGRVRDRHGAPGEPHGRDVRHRAGRPREARGRPCGTSSTSGRPPSSATSTSPGRSTGRPPPTGTSAARSSPGRRPTASTTSAPPS